MSLLRRQQGVALAVVLWFIAGMSLLVAGIVAQGRVDVQLTQAHRFRAQTAAAGDGAVMLLLADLVNARGAGASGNELPAGLFRLGANEVEVVAVPGSVLVDMNRASPELMRDLFRQVLLLDPRDAQMLAASVVEWRDARGGARRAGPSRFDVIEDLLRVEGLTRTMLDKLRDHIVVDPEAGGVSGGEVAGNSLWTLQRTLSPETTAHDGTVGAPRLPAMNRLLPGQSAATSRFYRVDAIVRFGPMRWLRRHWVSMGGTADSNLPWRAVRVESPRVVPS
jgi:general secretion pathway protein K